jgi:hypothetical protein
MVNFERKTASGQVVWLKVDATRCISSAPSLGSDTAGNSPSLQGVLHDPNTSVQRNSLGFDNFALNNSAIGDDPSPGML